VLILSISFDPLCRIKIHCNTAEVELSSVSTTPIDFNRLRDSWNNFSTACSELYGSIKARFSKSSNTEQQQPLNAAPTSTTTTQTTIVV
jgi:hypothetical protein